MFQIDRKKDNEINPKGGGDMVAQEGNNFLFPPQSFPNLVEYLLFIPNSISNWMPYISLLPLESSIHPSRSSFGPKNIKFHQIIFHTKPLKTRTSLQLAWRSHRGVNCLYFKSFRIFFLFLKFWTGTYDFHNDQNKGKLQKLRYISEI